MIIEQFYLSNPKNVDKAVELTEMSIGELASIVKYFTKQSHRYGQMKGLVCIHDTGRIIIKHHFTKKVLWSNI